MVNGRKEWTAHAASAAGVGLSFRFNELGMGEKGIAGLSRH